ncbi:MAG: RHS repeat-associated core domain-containing protein, partial [Puniceicoccales bacterium]
AGVRSKFDYDLANQLKVSHIGSETTRYRYDNAGRLVAELDGHDPVAEYRYGYRDRVVELVRNDTAVKYHYAADGMVAGKQRTDANNRVQMAQAGFGFFSSGSSSARYDYSDSGIEPWVWEDAFGAGGAPQGAKALLAKGGESYSNEPHISGGVPIAGTDRVSEDEKFFVSDYLGNTMMELPGRESTEFGKGRRDTAGFNFLTTAMGANVEVESSKSRPWGNERSEIGKSTEFGKGRRDTAGFSFLTTAMGANVESDGSLAGEESNPAMNRFTGKPYDEDLQAYVFPFRNYSAKLARWSSVDPAGFPDGPNRHFYAPVPTAGLDPMGLEEWTTVFDSREVPNGQLLEIGPSALGGYLFYEREYSSNVAMGTDWITFSPGSSVTRGISFSKTLNLSLSGGNKVLQVGVGASLTNTSSLSVNVGPDPNYPDATQWRVKFYAVPMKYRKVRISGDLDDLDVDILTPWSSNTNAWDINYVLHEI